MMPHTEQLVRTRAYQIWETEGRPEGHEQQNWDQAVREMQTAGNDEGQAIVGEVLLGPPAPKAAQRSNGPRLA